MTSALNRFLIPGALLVPLLITLTVMIQVILDNPSLRVEPALPGRDNMPEDLVGAETPVDIGEGFDEVTPKAQWPGPGEAGVTWACFRGQSMDFLAPDGLLPEITPITEVPEDDAIPQATAAWTAPMGEGYAAAAVAHDRVYVLDYDELRRADSLRCFEMKTGKELWRRFYRVEIKRNHGISRSIPAIWENTVVTVGPKSHTMGVDALSGELLWTVDMIKEYGTEVPMWHGGQCPLILDGVVYLAPAGPKALVIACDVRTGEVLWETPNPGVTEDDPEGWQQSHASLTPVTISGKKMLIYPALGGTAAISMEGEDAGTILCSTTDWNENVIAPSAVHLPGDRLYMTAGYGAGASELQVTGDPESGFEMTMLDEWRPIQGISSEQQTPILYEDHLYIVLPKSAGPRGELVACYHVDNLKKPVWTSPRGYRYGLGPLLIADGKLLVVDDNAVLTVFEATAEECRIIERRRLIPEGHDSWGPLALAQGYLFVRDFKNFAAFKVDTLFQN